VISVAVNRTAIPKKQKDKKKKKKKKKNVMMYL